MHTASVQKETKTPPPPSGLDDEVARDDHYIAYANGIVWDTNTDLEWMAGPLESNLQKAKNWVGSLEIGGGNWRMPTLEELKTLYQKGKGDRNRTPLLDTRAWRILSGEMGNFPTEAWSLNFYTLGVGKSQMGGIGVIAVRHRPAINDAAKSDIVTPTQLPKPSIESDSGDVRYITLGDGVVLDTKTGLEWMAGPDEGVNWHAAMKWVRELNGGEGTWRMPEIEELAALYDNGQGKKRILPLLQIIDRMVWSGVRYGGFSAWIFDFRYGRKENAPEDEGFAHYRALAVRPATVSVSEDQ